MDLQTFVSETLQQIVNGISHAHKNGVRSSGGAAENIEFDVAVTATEGTDKKGGLGLLVAGIGIGGQAGSSTANTTVSRIKFSVPVFLPDHQ
jgi:hypothetical protein